MDLINVDTSVGAVKSTSVSFQPSCAPLNSSESLQKNKKRSSRRGHQKSLPNKKPINLQSISFFDLPREVRDLIYFFVLRPDCRMSECHCSGHQSHYKQCSKVHHCIKSGLGCTKILVLNRQVHLEAIGFLNAFENIIRISGRSNNVFRDPLAFGKPGFFACDKKTSRCPLGPSLSELQILRLRHLAVELRYSNSVGNDSDPYSERSKLGSEVKGIAAALLKTNSLQTFRLILQTKDVEDASTPSSPDYRPMARRNNRDMQGLLQLLLDAAQTKGIRTAAEEQKHFIVRNQSDDYEPVKIDRYLDPLVTWYNQKAADLSAFAVFKLSYEDQLVARPYEHEDRIFQNGFYGDRCMTSEAMKNEEWGEEFRGFTQLRGDLRGALPGIKRYIHEDPKKEWELLPECRKCYQIFDCIENLHAPLELRPKHKIPFTRKTYNMLDRRAKHGGSRKCWTCAASVGNLLQWEEHNEKTGHARTGMIPRWRQDNWWYPRRMKRTGGL
jgi:hypothetical protein